MMTMVIRYIRAGLIGIVCGILYSGCSHGVIKSKPIHTKLTPELEKYRGYVQKISKGKLGNKEITIGYRKFNDKDPNLLGVCTFTLENLGKEIDIVEEAWQYLSHNEKLLLVAHEFRHCECNELGHEERYFKDKCSKTIMHKYLPDRGCIKKHMNDYLEEIRRGCGD